MILCWLTESCWDFVFIVTRYITIIIIIIINMSSSSSSIIYKLQLTVNIINRSDISIISPYVPVKVSSVSWMKAFNVKGNTKETSDQCKNVRLWTQNKR